MKFSQKMPVDFFYTMVQKSQKMAKNSNQGGGPEQVLNSIFDISFQVFSFCQCLTSSYSLKQLKLTLGDSV